MAQLAQTATYKDNKIYLDASYLDVLERVISIESETKILHADNKRLWQETKALRQETKEIRQEIKELKQETKDLREDTNNKFLEMQKQSNKYLTILLIAMGVGTAIITFGIPLLSNLPN